MKHLRDIINGQKCGSLKKQIFATFSLVYYKIRMEELVKTCQNGTHKYPTNQQTNFYIIMVLSITFFLHIQFSTCFKLKYTKKD